MNNHIKIALSALALGVAQAAFIIFFSFSDYHTVFASMGFDKTGQYLLLACGCLFTLKSFAVSIFAFSARQVHLP